MQFKIFILWISIVCFISGCSKADKKTFNHKGSKPLTGVQLENF